MNTVFLNNMVEGEWTLDTVTGLVQAMRDNGLRVAVVDRHPTARLIGGDKASGMLHDWIHAVQDSPLGAPVAEVRAKFDAHRMAYVRGHVCGADP